MQSQSGNRQSLTAHCTLLVFMTMYHLKVANQGLKPNAILLTLSIYTFKEQSK